MTAKRRIMAAMNGQTIGRSYARNALGMVGVTYTRAITELRNAGLIQVARARRGGWEYALTDAGREIVRGWK